jgi:hypothetical protein
MKRSQSKHIRTLDITKQIEGICVGKIVSIDENRQVFVDYAGNSHGPVTARCTSSVKLESLRNAKTSEQDVLLAFENNDPLRPIIIDTISYVKDENEQTDNIDLKVDELKDITVNSKKITFDAKDQIVLKCGQASITLTKAGKILVRGAYLLSRSTGVNRIKGGSVQIN